MTFLNYFGLLGLLGIPILIIIYIIKSKYAEQTVSSTYLWTLSEKFLKRKKPISPLAGIVSLILQILTVTVISLIIARPIITIPGSAKEYCFILDASGSMNITDEDEVSRFSRAKSEIEDIVDSARDGSKYTLVVASDVTTTVIDATTDKKALKNTLAELSEGYAAPDYSDAIGVAQRCFDENPGALTYLFTDTEYRTHNNINIINVAKDEVNAAITGVVCSIESGKLKIAGGVESFGVDGTLSVKAYLDGKESPSGECTVEAKAGQTVPFSIEINAAAYNSVRLTLSANDSLSLDNEYVRYNVRNENAYKILLVSDYPFFIETGLGANGYNKLTVIKPEDYSASMSGYGLYIFDSCSPKTLPSDGAVWFFNPVGSIADAGFTVQTEVPLDTGEALKMEKSSSSIAKKITANLKESEEIIIKEYIKCSLYSGFTPIFTYNGTPIIFAGNNVKGHREVVVAFDLHDSNLPLQPVSFIALLQNFMSFSFPAVVEETSYFAGENADVNIVANCESVRVESPSGVVNYLNTDSAIASFTVSEVGTYDVTVTVSGIAREYNIYSSVPESERDPSPKREEIKLVGEAEDVGFDGTFDPLTVLLITLVLLLLADWMVYCYEKYQLR